MQAITLRNVPPDLADKIEQEAKRTNADLEATVIGLLLQAMSEDSQGKTAEKRDLSSFAGSWTKEETDAFDAFLAEERRVDPDDWR